MTIEQWTREMGDRAAPAIERLIRDAIASDMPITDLDERFALPAEGRQRVRLVIVESPYKARWWWQRWLNRRYARACLRNCLNRGEAPFASHLLYTQPGVLRDGVEIERWRGIVAGLAWGQAADVTAVYTDRGISEGMKHGIAAAETAGRPIEYRTLGGGR